MNRTQIYRHTYTDICKYVHMKIYTHMTATHFTSGLACMLHIRMYIHTGTFEEITPGHIRLQHTVSVDQTCMLQISY